MAEGAVRKKILIIDDDQPSLDLYAELFRGEGFEVSLAHDGQEGWDELRSGKIPDVVFTGIIMPRMSGFDLLRRMKADPAFAKIPVAISSHQGIPEHRKLAEELGAREFIVRDLTPPREVLRRMKLLSGVGEKFTIAFLVDRHDGRTFTDYLGRLHGTPRTPGQEATLEIETGHEGGTFKIELGG